MNNFYNHYPLLFAIILFVLGAFLSWFFTWFFTNRKKISYIASSSPLIRDENKNELKELKVHYKDREITNGTITLVKFQNSGNSNIDYAKDFVKNYGIKLEIEPIYEILTAEILYETDASIQSKVIITENRFVELLFENIERQDEIKLKILHTGNGVDDFTFSGKLKGGKVKYLFGW